MKFHSPNMRDTTDASLYASPDWGAEIAFAYVGSLVPDEPRFHNAAFNRSGQLYQQELLLGLRRSGLHASLILSVTPSPAYPNSERIWIRGGVAQGPEALPLNLFSFLNITPFKQIMIGVATVWRLLLWRWRTRQAKLRIVYSYNLTVPPGMFTLLGAWLIGAKTVVSLCDINVPGETAPMGWPWRLDYWLQRRLIPHFDGHVVASDAIAREFLPGSPYLRLEGGIRDEMLGTSHDRHRVNEVSGKPFVITAAGAVNEANGILLLLQAFSMLQGDQYRLCIAGGGPLEAKVREAAAGDSRIEYAGIVPLSEVLRLYSRSDVLVNARITKNINTKYFFPGKMMEYLASGTPVITTCTGHTEEEFGDFVYLLRDETPQGLAEIIRYVAAQDPQVRTNLGRTAQKYMARNKTWEAQARKAAQFIREVVLEINAPPLAATKYSADGFLDAQPPAPVTGIQKAGNK
jgi:glycosyltransferase involved in cell wall biosynthesis